MYANRQCGGGAAEKKQEAKMQEKLRAEIYSSFLEMGQMGLPVGHTLQPKAAAAAPRDCRRELPDFECQKACLN